MVEFCVQDDESEEPPPEGEGEAEDSLTSLENSLAAEEGAAEKPKFFLPSFCSFQGGEKGNYCLAEKLPPYFFPLKSEPALEYLCLKPLPLGEERYSIEREGEEGETEEENLAAMDYGEFFLLSLIEQAPTPEDFFGPTIYDTDDEDLKKLPNFFRYLEKQTVVSEARKYLQRSTN